MPNDYQCCFCGKKIVNERPDPVMLSIELSDSGGEAQQLYSHYRCLKGALDPSVPLLPAEN
jgi:hypothetical protein